MGMKAKKTYFLNVAIGKNHERAKQWFELGLCTVNILIINHTWSSLYELFFKIGIASMKEAARERKRNMAKEVSTVKKGHTWEHGHIPLQQSYCSRPGSQFFFFLLCSNSLLPSHSSSCTSSSTTYIQGRGLGVQEGEMACPTYTSACIYWIVRPQIHVRVDCWRERKKFTPTCLKFLYKI